MKRIAALRFVCAIFFATIVASPLYAYEDPNFPRPFPLNRAVDTSSYSSGFDFYLNTTRTVSKDDKNNTYSYTIVVNYKSDKQLYFSWNLLDWILSNYPNAVKHKRAQQHLFPIEVGESKYVFTIKNAEAPVYSGNTLVQIFPRTPRDKEGLEYNKETGSWSGVSVSSYDYLAPESEVGFVSCLPRNLLVFPRNSRSGF